MWWLSSWQASKRPAYPILEICHLAGSGFILALASLALPVVSQASHQAVLNPEPIGDVDFVSAALFGKLGVGKF